MKNNVLTRGLIAYLMIAILGILYSLNKIRGMDYFILGGFIIILYILLIEKKDAQVSDGEVKE